MEEQFEDVLSCAQRAGFSNFDNMALDYYTRDFHPASALALEQRQSRNRHLPELLGEIRKQSTTWSALQRRGYQDATMKAAEDICAAEFNEFRTTEINEDLNEGVLEDMVSCNCPDGRMYYYNT